MENRLKERLTGAAILVALIVILVPQMFRGQGGGPSSTAPSSSGDGPPVRSYTIDLSNNPKSSVPLQSTNESGDGPAAAPSPAPATSTPVPPAAQAAPVTAPPAAAVTAPASPVHIARTATSPPSTASSPASPPSSSSAPATAKAATAPPTSPASTATVRTAANAGWSVQLGLFAKRENAERQMSDAKAKGFAASISNADAKGMFHVRVAGLADRATAQAVELKLKAQGLPAAVVAP